MCNELQVPRVTQWFSTILRIEQPLSRKKKNLKMSKLPKTFLSVKKVTDLLNGDDSDLNVDDNIDDSDNYLDKDDLPIG
jgi:hypothetical protein